MPRFANLDGSGPNAGRMVFRWAVLDRLNGRRRRTPPTAAVPAVAPDPALLATAPAPGEPARITWLGHASWLVGRGVDHREGTSDLRPFAALEPARPLRREQDALGRIRDRGLPLAHLPRRRHRLFRRLRADRGAVSGSRRGPAPHRGV